MLNKRTIVASLVSAFFFTCVYASPLKLDDSSKVNSDQIEKLTGAKGQLDQQEKVFKVSVPRADLKVTIKGVKFIPAMGLTSWAAFKQVDSHTMVMGDLVLTENQ